jgi:hypothetical protein
MEISTIGIDLSKTTFHIIGLNTREEIGISQNNRRKRSADEILKRQQAVYQPQIQRMALHLVPQQAAGDDLPTDVRAKRVSEGANDLACRSSTFSLRDTY